MTKLWTIILRFEDSQCVVLCTENIENCLRERENKTGYFSHKSRGKGKLVFVVPGNFESKIRAFGAKAFMEMIKAYDPINDALNQIIHK